MKCPEVIEWMHRYLDNDLNEENTTQLMEHIAHCSQCAESFRMLKSLAHELEELPHVVPKYSLVDAIMPQLDAIDRARLEKCASKERSTEEMVPMSPPVIVPKRRFFTSTAARTMIGAVAAMGILGVAIFNNPPEQISDAQIQAKTTAGADLGAAAEQKTVDNNAANNTANNAGVSVTSFDTTLQEIPASNPEGSPDIDQITPEPQQDTDVKLPPESLEPSESSVGGVSTPDANSTKVTDTPKQTEEDPKQLSKDVPDPSSSHDNSRVIDPDKAQAEDEVTPKATSISEPSEGITVDPIPSQDNVMSKIRAFGLVAPQAQSWDSPDGKVTVVLEAQKLVVYQLPSKVVLQSFDLAGTWVSGEWSADSKVFTYQITLDGKVSSYTYPNDMATPIAP